MLYLELQENFKRDYISMRLNLKQDGVCCKKEGTSECFCHVYIYKIRPYTYEFLRAIQPFFEVIIFSNMHYKLIEGICNHIEEVLNEPIKKFIQRKLKKRSSKFGGASK